MLILIKHLEQRLTHKYTFSVCYHQYLSSQVAILGRHCLAWTQIEQASHLFLKKIIYSFLLGCAVSSLLHTCFSSCGELGLLYCCTWASHCSGFSCGPGSRAHGLSSCSIQAWFPRGTWDLSSQTRDWTYVPCIGSQILNHWTTREVPKPVTLLLTKLKPWANHVSSMSLNFTIPTMQVLLAPHYRSVWKQKWVSVC